MKKLLVLLFVVVGFFGVKAIVNSLQEPASGTVVVMDDPMVNDMGGVDGTTVMTEEEVEEVEEMEPIVVVEEEPAPMPVFQPLAFDGKLGKFAKANGGKKVNVPSAFVKKYNTKKKGVRVGGDFYFESNDGTLYVFHAGEVIIIDGIDETQTAFCAGYKKGYIAGYCYKVYGCLKPLTPLCPLPDLGETGYKDGYNRGFIDGLEDQ